MNPRALVIGGSLGGLLAANTLRRIGWRVDVFERSPHALDNRGGGIVLQPDARRDQGERIHCAAGSTSFCSPSSSTNTASNLAGLSLLALRVTWWRAPGSSYQDSPVR